MLNPIDLHVGKKLRFRRNMLGISQKDLGNSLGISFQQIQKYELGVNRVSASRIFDFAKYLIVPVSYFFEGLELKPNNYNFHGLPEENTLFEDGKMASRETIEMMRAYYKIYDPNIRNKVLLLIKSLADDKIVSKPIQAPDKIIV